MDNLCRYLRQKHIEAGLAQPVEQHVRHRLRKRDQCGCSDVPVLGVMSSSLRQEPHYAMCERHLITHPLFRTWSGLSVATAETMCSEACKVVHLQSSDHLCRAGTRMSEAYCVIQGKGSCRCEFDTLSDAIDVGAGCCLSEAAVWMHRIHVGSAITETNCICLVVDAAGVVASPRHGHVKGSLLLTRRCSTRGPCRPCHQWRFRPIARCMPRNLSLSLVVDMPHAARVLVGLAAFRQACSLQWLFRLWDLAKLKSEVLSGQSMVLISGAGELERIPPVMGVRNFRDDHPSLCSWPSGALSLSPRAYFQVPRCSAGKECRGEDPQDQSAVRDRPRRHQANGILHGAGRCRSQPPTCARCAT